MMSEPRVLSVRQPWASLIVAGYKDVENRSWQTRYRGELLIHASRNPDREAVARWRTRWPEYSRRTMPLGALVGLVTLTDIVTDSRSAWADPGDYHWLLEDAVEFDDPFPVKGRLGLWSPPEEWWTHIG